MNVELVFVIIALLIAAVIVVVHGIAKAQIKRDQEFKKRVDRYRRGHH